MALVPAEAEASGLAARLDAALRANLMVAPPAGLRERLLALLPAEQEALSVAAARLDAAVRTDLVVEPPLALRRELQALVPAQPRGWLARLWQWIAGGERGLVPSPSVLAGQLAAVVVLAYAMVQLFSWLSSLPIVLGDVPYALELLIWSPASDYLPQIQGLLQQLALWLLVGGIAWLLALWRPAGRQPTVS